MSLARKLRAISVGDGGAAGQVPGGPGRRTLGDAGGARGRTMHTPEDDVATLSQVDALYEADRGQRAPLAIDSGVDLGSSARHGSGRCRDRQVHALDGWRC